MVAAREQGGTRGATDRSGMEAIVAKTLGGEFVEIGRRNESAEGRGLAESDVIEKDHEDIRRAFWGGNRVLPGGFGFFVGRGDFPFEGRKGNRQFGPIWPLLGNAGTD